jgi:hypothetical protein
MEEQEDDFNDDEESPGRYFPNLLKSDDDEGNGRARKRCSKKVNNSWPPMSRFFK